MVDVQTFSIAVASAGVVAGIIYYAFQVRHQTKLRQTDLIMRLHSQPSPAKMKPKQQLKYKQRKIYQRIRIKTKQQQNSDDMTSLRKARVIM